MQSTDEQARALRAAGLRVTAPRLAVLRALLAQPHADTETVIGSARTELGSVSPQAIYNVLGALVQTGLVRRIEPAGSPALYELRVGDNHHHAVCRRCGTTADIDCAVRRRPCLTPSETHGYLLDEAEVTFWGLCPTCQHTAPPPADPATRSSSRSPLTPTAVTTHHEGAR
ncbi:MAG: Fur family transcriptional regulator [Acidimicrobiales bacterium]|jgi:Fur family ferric uptake transcriptional regulator